MTAREQATHYVAQFQALPLRVRAAAGVGLAALIAVCLATANWPAPAPEHYLLAGREFTAEELAPIEAAFAKRKLNRYEVVSGKIRVPHREQGVYLDAISAEQALPDAIGDELTAASRNLSPWQGREQQAETLKSAKQKMLSRIIGQIDGIAKGYVVLDSRTTAGLRRETHYTAAVSVEGKNGQPIDRAKIAQIRHLVAASVAGLETRNVTVIDLKGGTLAAGAEAAPAPADDGQQGSPYLSRMSAYQAYYQERVLETLAFVPGVSAAIQVELDKKLREVVDFERRVPLSAAPASYENPAVDAAGNPLPAGEAGQTRERSHIEHATLTPTKVTAVVHVPARYYEQVWEQRQPGSGPPSAVSLAALVEQENTRLRHLVAQVIPGCSEPALAHERVTVTMVEPLAPKAAAEPVSIGPAPVVQPAAGIPDAGIWVGACVATGALLLWWLRPRPAAVTPGAPRFDAGAAALAPHFHAEPAEEMKTAAVNAEPHAEPASAELRELVQHDPAAAAQILRGWISQAH